MNKSNKHFETHIEKLTQDDDNQKSFTFYESVISMETEFELEEKNSSGADWTWCNRDTTQHLTYFERNRTIFDNVILKNY